MCEHHFFFRILILGYSLSKHVKLYLAWFHPSISPRWNETDVCINVILSSSMSYLLAIWRYNQFLLLYIAFSCTEFVATFGTIIIWHYWSRSLPNKCFILFDCLTYHSAVKELEEGPETDSQYRLWSVTATRTARCLRDCIEIDHLKTSLLARTTLRALSFKTSFQSSLKQGLS